MAAPESKIDENLYSRQIGVFGMETMGKLMSMDVLLVGLRGAGVETAKNLILAGPRSVTLLDPEPVALGDLSENYFLKESDVGRGRAEASLEKLAELNNYVKVGVLEEDSITAGVASRFQCVVMTNTRMSEMVRVNEVCRMCSPQVAFVGVQIAGAAGFVFSDFGDKHGVRDPDGEPVRSAIVVSVSQAKGGIVMCHDASPMRLSDGDSVVFREVEGMTELNDGRPRRIRSVSRKAHSFELDPEDGGNTEGFGAYTTGGIVTEVKVPRERSFKSLKARIADPVPAEGMMITPDFGKFGRSEQLHVAFQALGKWQDDHDGKLPEMRNIAQIREVAKVAGELNAEHKWVEEVDNRVVETVAGLAAAEIPSLGAFFGGIAAQEVVKVTGKYTPIDGFLYLDAFEALPQMTEAPAADEFEPRGNRYDRLVQVFGRTLMTKLANQKVFVVGAGALGCEMLKNLALMGVGTGAEGHVTVTDMDTIETSNLNRQFLFRSKDVGQPKSVTAAAAAMAMNPDLRMEALEVPVGPDTEKTFDDAFWSGLDFVVNALDNVKARTYVDSKIVFFRKPLLESGTLGTKANMQVIVPFKTESYADSVDPQDDTIPMCTVRNFPNQIEHCIEWSREFFTTTFTTAIQEAATFASDPEAWLKDVGAERNNSVRRARLEGVDFALNAASTASFKTCVAAARKLFNDKFYLLIRQLLNQFPADYVDKSGAKFWSGPKRAPAAIDFDLGDDLHFAFIQAGAGLVAAAYGVELPTDGITREAVAPILAGVEVEPFVPKKMTFKTSEEDKAEEGADDDRDAIEATTTKLRAVATGAQSLAGKSLDSLRLTPAEFEKDDDSNFHIDFIAATANLRARNYTIKEESRHTVKMIAGKIVPAIATTTCTVTGLVGIELYKVVQDVAFERYRNSFFNLGINVYALAEPAEPKKTVSKEYDPMVNGPIKAIPEGFTSWDQCLVKEGRDLLVRELVDLVQDRYNVEVSMVNAGTKMMFAPLLFAHHADRAEKPVKEVYEACIGEPLGELRSYICLDFAVEDDSGDCVIPPVVYYYK